MCLSPSVLFRIVSLDKDFRPLDEVVSMILFSLGIWPYVIYVGKGRKEVSFGETSQYTEIVVQFLGYLRSC